MKIYNSLTRGLDNLNKKVVNMYACGPTVYNYVHIGNARAALTVDLLYNYLTFINVKVNYLQNYTDVDDKIIIKAAKENVTETELSQFYIKAYETDMANLNLTAPTTRWRISDFIDDIIKFITVLIEKKYAYEINGNVYFAIENIQDQYGKLSHQVIDQLIQGSRIEVDDNKKNPLDFVVWKKTDGGVLYDSPWGKGRPGWHTECAVLIDKYFDSQTIDIHAGGIDLIFPHHENERIQYLAKNNCEIAKIWFHNGHLTLKSEKMSKSLGNIITVRDFLKKYDGNILKYIIYTVSYSQPLNITPELINFAANEVNKIYQLLLQINLYLAKNNLVFNLKKHGTILKKVLAILDDNLNIPNVLTIINETIKKINIQIREDKIKIESVSDFYNIIINLLRFKFDLPVITPDILLKIKQWEELKAKKDFINADQIRNELVTIGIINK